MIHYVKSFFSKNECLELIKYYKNIQSKLQNDNIYRFYFVDLLENKLEIEKLKTYNFKKIRIQKVDETINQVENFHSHINPWSFIIFLNDDFEGGQVCFSETKYKPIQGDMIYFSGEELHKVENCKGERFTLVGFMYNNPLGISLNGKTGII